MLAGDVLCAFLSFRHHRRVSPCLTFDQVVPNFFPEGKVYTESVSHNLKFCMGGFLEFVRKQGVIGLAVGFLLGGAVSKVVTALVTDIINPLLGVVFGITEGLKEARLEFSGVVILWGDFVAVAIDFIVIAAVVYYGVRILGVEVSEKKSAKKK